MALLSRFSLPLGRYSVYQGIYNTAVVDRLIQYNSDLDRNSNVYSELYSYCQRYLICLTNLLDRICIFVKTTAANFFVIIN